MNNEKYNQIIDEAYENYWRNAKHNNLDCLVKQEQDSLLVEMRFYYKEEFIKEIKTNPMFSERCGLKIEERELSYEERCKIVTGKDLPYSELNNSDKYKVDYMYEHNIPTKLITVTYNNETIEVYG